MEISPKIHLPYQQIYRVSSEGQIGENTFVDLDGNVEFLSNHLNVSEYLKSIFVVC